MSDRLVLGGEPGSGFENYEPTDIENEKTAALTSRVLLATSGDVPLCAEFERRLRERVKPADDLATCRDAANEVVEQMWEANEHGIAVVDGHVAHQSSIRETTQFHYVLNGFLADGGTGIVRFNREQRDDKTIFSSPDTYQVVGTKPPGVDDIDIGPLTMCRDEVELADLRTPAGGFRLAFNYFNWFGSFFPTRISETLDACILLPPNDDGTSNDIAFPPFSWHDVEGATKVYDMIHEQFMLLAAMWNRAL